LSWVWILFDLFSRWGLTMATHVLSSFHTKGISPWVGQRGLMMKRQDDKVQAQRALNFARQHDWGKLAWVVHAGKRGWIIVDLIAADNDAGQIPATVQAVREFGNY
jgi:hypothetical protein